MREKAEKEAKEDYGKKENNKKGNSDNKPKTLAEKQKAMSEELAKKRTVRAKGV
jgi:hypothetical protein